MAPTGRIYVADSSAGPGSSGVIFGIDPGGAPVPLFSGPPLSGPYSIAVGPDGILYIADFSTGANGAIFRLDPASGVLSTVEEGPPFDAPTGVAIAPNGDLFALGSDGTFPLHRVDPATGARSLVVEGPPFVFPERLVIEPPRCKGKLATIVGSTGRDTAHRKRLRRRHRRPRRQGQDQRGQGQGPGLGQQGQGPGKLALARTGCSATPARTRTGEWQGMSGRQGAKRMGCETGGLVSGARAPPPREPPAA